MARTWWLLSERYGFDALLTRVSALGRGDRWEVQARAALRVDLYDVLRRLTSTLLAFGAGQGSSAGVDPVAAVEAWERLHPATVSRARTTLDDVEAAGRADLAVLAVALRRLRHVIDRA